MNTPGCFFVNFLKKVGGAWRSCTLQVRVAAAGPCYIINPLAAAVVVVACSFLFFLLLLLLLLLLSSLSLSLLLLLL